MKVIPFKSEHIQQAVRLAELNFKEENNRLQNILPKANLPDLSQFADNNLGVAAFDGDTMLGFICCYGPCHNLFGKSDGIYSPVHANAAVHANRQKIYSAMYQFASNIWVENKLLSHSITLYANDSDAINSFFDNGFGKRCVDAAMDMNKYSYVLKNVEHLRELHKSKFSKVHKLSNLTNEHLQRPPAFMPRKPVCLDKFMENLADDTRIFVTKKDNEIIGFIKAQSDGETFISQNKHMMNITGAYVLDKYRGMNIASDLINYTVDALKKDGDTHLGVDYESINPTANSFWQKHFTPYTYSLTRRIDERIIEYR